MGERTKETLKCGERERREIDVKDGRRRAVKPTLTCTNVNHKWHRNGMFQLIYCPITNQSKLHSLKTTVICFDGESAVWAERGSMQCLLVQLERSPRHTEAASSMSADGCWASALSSCPSVCPRHFLAMSLWLRCDQGLLMFEGKGIRLPRLIGRGAKNL